MGEMVLRDIYYISFETGGWGALTDPRKRSSPCLLDGENPCMYLYVVHKSECHHHSPRARDSGTGGRLRHIWFQTHMVPGHLVPHNWSPIDWSLSTNGP